MKKQRIRGKQIDFDISDLISFRGTIEEYCHCFNQLIDYLKEILPEGEIELSIENDIYEGEIDSRAILFREETDEEYRKRLDRQKKEREKKKAAKAAAEEQERRLYEKLKEKYA